MKLRFHHFDLALRHTFTIARGSTDLRPVLIVSVERDGVVGYGETSPSGYHGQTVETVRRDLEALAPWLERQDPAEFRLLLEEAGRRLGENAQALCALDLAIHDWAGKRLGVPVWRLFGLRRTGLPPTCYTIGIDSAAKMVEKLREFADFPVFKIKLGRAEDMDLVAALRAASSAVFRVDANCAWSAEETVEKSKRLAGMNVEFIEQPMAKEKLDEMAGVIGRSALPLVADENAVVPEDVPRLAGRFHGINIKLVKCGGLQPALKMIAMARTLGMKIMIGCMVESSACCTAAAHLGSLVDWLDLDGPLLIGNDPFRGMKIEAGRIELSDAPGLGIEPREALNLK